MTIDRHKRKVLDKTGAAVVRAKYAKEIMVAGSSQAPIQFGDDTLTLGDVEEWLREQDTIDARWTMIAAIAAVLAALFSFLAWLFPRLSG